MKNEILNICSELKVGPSLVGVLENRTIPIQKLGLIELFEDEQTVWGELVGKNEFRIIAPIWGSFLTAYGDVVRTFPPNHMAYPMIDEVISHSGWVTLAVLPNAPEYTVDDAFEALNEALAGIDWICQVLESSLLIVTLSPAARSRIDELDEAIARVGLTQDSGPWIHRFLDATRKGDRAKALPEFISGNEYDEEDEEDLETTPQAA